MYKVFKIILFLLFGLLISCGPQKEFIVDSSNDLPKEFYQRWKLDYGTLNGEKVSGFPQSPDNDYLFKTDGTYISYASKGDNMIGTWEYEAAEKRVFTRREDGVINAILKDITPNGFTLIPPKKSVELSPLTSLTFYYIPKSSKNFQKEN